MKSFKTAVAVVLALLMVTAGMAVAGTLQDVQKNGFVTAGVNGGVFGFSMPDEKGVWKGLDVDTAKAVAAAVFGDANKSEICSADRRAAPTRPSVQRN